MKDPRAPTPAISVRELTKSYGASTALRGVSFEIAAGEMFGLLGPNGAGKTTLISILTGLVRRTSGAAEIFGMDVTRDYRTTRSLVGVVPQELIVDHFFSVRRALEIHSGYYGRAGNGPWIRHLMDRLDLTPHADKKITALSGGMKRRLLVAKALVHQPRVLILDEPTAGVDVGLRQSLWEFVREIHESGTTVLLTTHYIEEAEEHCQRIGIIDEGRLIALDRTENLLSLLSEKRVTFTLASPVSAVPPPLLRLGAELLPDRLHVVATVASADGDLSEVMAALRQSGLEVRDVEVRRADLEDVFLHLTGTGRRDFLEAGVRR
jgi:ABC-2 type transport system ATP-binding protein